MLDVDVSTICRFLYSSGFTRQKLCYAAIQRNEFLRQKCMLDMSLYEIDMLIFLDETGADRRNTLRRYVWLQFAGKAPAETIPFSQT